jgi:glycosyltransferase involved in cell wall biosynthesis
MKKMLNISPGPTYNSSSRLYQSLYEELSKQYKGYIFTTSPKNESFHIGFFRYSSVRSKNTKLDMIKFFLYCLWSSFILRTKGEKIDLVVTYDPLRTGLIGLFVSRLLKSKFAPEVNGVYTSPAEWLDEPENMKNILKRKMYPLIMRLVLKRADGIRLLFKGQIDPFKDITKGKVICHFSRFVPKDMFKNIREDKEVLFVGFPFKRKGVDVLIQAFKQIAPRYPEWKLKILGWYPNTDELYKAIDGHPRIYHHPPVKQEQMIEHMGSCAILVLPSRSEAMGRVLLEAMAAEKPRIGSNVDGIPTVIDDGVDGLLVKPGDADDLAEKLDMLMGNPELRKRMGQAGKARVTREFTREIYFDNLLKFYKEVLES